MKLDFKNAKKIASDEHTSTFQLPAGHQVKVAHRSLSPENQKIIKALPHFDGGGNVSDSPKVDPAKAKAFQDSFNSSGGWQPQKWAENIKSAFSSDDTQKKAKGGTLQHYANGTGDVQDPTAPDDGTANSSQMPPQQDTPDAIANDAALQENRQPPPQPLDPALAAKRNIYNSLVKPDNAGHLYGMESQDKLFGPNGEAPQDFDTNAWTNAETKYDSNQKNQAAAFQQSKANIDNQNAVRAKAGLAPLEQAAGANTPTPTTPQDSGPTSQFQPVNQDLYGIGKSMDTQMHGIGSQMQGARDAATAQGNLGAAKSAQEALYVGEKQRQAEEYQKALDPILAQRKAITDDINNQHIDPKRFVNDMSTGKRITTSIGLILGGMGAGLTNGPNYAFQNLQESISRDIDSQKADLGKKQNLLSHNFDQTHDLRAAYDLTRLQTNDVLESHLRQEADKAQSPLAKANMEGIIGQLQGQQGILQHNMAMYKMQQNAFSGNGTGISLEALPKDMRERAVQMPGGGLRLAITPEGAKQVREQLQSTQPIFDSLDKLQSLGKSALVPGSAANQQAHAIRAQLIPLVNESAGLKRLSAEDIENIKQMINDPTKFSNLVGGNMKNAQFKAFMQDKIRNAMNNQLEGGAQQQRPAAAANIQFTPRGK